MDFSHEDEKVAVVQQKNGSRPQAENPDKTKPVELVQHSEAQEKGTKANEAPEATVDDFGDVEKYEPPREKEINKKALFHAADNKTDKDTLAAQTARKVSDALKEGHAQGNAATGKTTGEPNAVVKGRSVNGTIAKPAYSVQDAGIVVVSIWVDQYGITFLSDNRFNRHLLKSKICKMENILGEVQIIPGKCSSYVIFFLIPAFCQLLKLRNNKIIASGSIAEWTHLIIDLFSSIQT